MAKYETDDAWKAFTIERQKYNSMYRKAKLESWEKKIYKSGNNAKNYITL